MTKLNLVDSVISQHLAQKGFLSRERQRQQRRQVPSHGHCIAANSRNKINKKIKILHPK